MGNTKRKTYARVVWTAQDIIDAACNHGIGMDDTTAEEWLMANERHIQDRLIALGWDVIDSLLDCTLHESAKE